MKKLLLTGLCALAIGGISQAQLITNNFSGTFSFAGTVGFTNSLPYNGTAIADVLVGDLTKNGVTDSSSTGNFRGSAWALDDAPVGGLTGLIDLGKYFELTLTADPGTTLNMTSVTFGIGRSATGPRTWEWRSSVDGFASAITTFSNLNAGLTEASGVITNPDANSSWTGNVLDLSAPSFSGLSTISLRFYGYNSETNAGTGGFQGNLSFSGASVVPEPSTYALLALAGAGLAGHMIRRRRR
jgi:hypothetical protein